MFSDNPTDVSLAALLFQATANADCLNLWFLSYWAVIGRADIEGSKRNVFEIMTLEVGNRKSIFDTMTSGQKLHVSHCSCKSPSTFPQKSFYVKPRKFKRDGSPSNCLRSKKPLWLLKPAALPPKFKFFPCEKSDFSRYIYEITTRYSLIAFWLMFVIKF